MSTQVNAGDARHKLIIDEMNRILADHRFKSSQRCMKMLSHLVSLSLSGNHDRAKERTLGIEVFGRPASYDTNADPVVRATASEIRKRLAQYYQESSPNPSVKIQLLPGTYLLEFAFSSESPLAEPGQSESPILADGHSPAPPRSLHAPAEVRSVWKLRWILLAFGVLAVCLLGLLIKSVQKSQSTQSLIWKPLLKSQQPVILSLADDPVMIGSDDVMRAHALDAITSSRVPAPGGASESIPLTRVLDASAANQVTNWLASHSQQTDLRRASRATISDFRKAPAVLLGGLDNPWSVILLSGFRFSMRINPEEHFLWIEDAQNPAKRDWKIDSRLPYSSSSVDYALITRYYDLETSNWVIALGGLGLHGTRMATELLTDPTFDDLLPASLRTAGNFQVVLKADVINGYASSPQIVATHTW